MRLRDFIPVLLLFAGLWAYHNSFHGPFIFDDEFSIIENPRIRHFWPTGDAAVSNPFSAVNGRPVACLSLALNYALNGLNVPGYHAFNFSVHLLSALVLFGLLRRTFETAQYRGQFGSAAPWLAAAIALIWEVHPLQTESVNYLVQRTELLMGLSLLLTLYCAARGAQSPRPRRWQMAAVISCALGMGSKEVMVCAPLLVLLYDRVFLASSFRDLWRRRGGMYAGLAATWLILVALVLTTHHPATRFGIEGLTAGDYLETEAGVIVYYLRLCFWPHPLALDYFDWPITRSLTDALAAGFVVVGLFAVTAWALIRRPWLGFWGAWFFLILAPTSSFLPSLGEAAAERRMYLPLAAVITLALSGAYALGKRLLCREGVAALGCLAAVVVVVLLTNLTLQRNRDYHSAQAIWQDTVAKRPNNPRAHNNLGYVLLDAGNAPEARREFEQALRLKADYAEAHNNLGFVLFQGGNIREAIGHYEEALQIIPDYAVAEFNLGNALRRAGRLPEAIGHFEKALRIEPDYAEAHNNLGAALAAQGRLPEAIGHYEQALRLKPDYAEAQNNLGNALFQAGRGPEAIGHLERALRIKPEYVEAHNNLGNALLQAGNVREAIGHYEQALRIKPGLAEAHNNLGYAFLLDGNVPEAIGHFEQALQASSLLKKGSFWENAIFPKN